MLKHGQAGTKENHVGYYLISDGIEKLYNSLGIKKKNVKSKIKFKTNLYIYGILFLSLIFTIAFGILIYIGMLRSI